MRIDQRAIDAESSHRNTANASDIAAENSAWHQWSLDAILQRFADCCRSLSSALSECVV
ncbi:hypothetical protein ONK27_29075, partial [Salmonella enterica subsp. enterica serovar Virginia]|nr:hypothetical protein [Salmonella enterica subsp. enterica serovar Virginia]